MAHLLNLKEKAKRLRLQGYSIKRIAKLLGISISTSSLWMRDILLPAHIKKYLERQAGEGRAKGWKVLRAMRDHQNDLYREEAKASLRKMNFTGDVWRLIGSLIYWCEGSKRDLHSGARLANSDPELVRLFLHAMRKGFGVEEKKLKALLHLHSYHDRERQTLFWSKITGIPKKNFYSPYIKPNTGKRIREGYPGCISLTCGGAKLARTIDAYYRAIVQQSIGA